MLPRRLLFALALLALLVGGGVALAAWHVAPEAGSGRVAVLVMAPDGSMLFDGEVELEDATALAALLAAAEAAGFEVETERYGGMGTYVRTVDGHRAHGSAGWVYDVWEDGAWRFGDRSAEFQPLADGQAVRWRWSEL